MQQQAATPHFKWAWIWNVIVGGAKAITAGNDAIVGVPAPPTKLICTGTQISFSLSSRLTIWKSFPQL